MSEEWDTGVIEVADELGRRRARERSRARALPKPSKVWASLFRTLAWLGSIVTVALVVPTITAHDLIAPGGLATAVGRVTGMVGTYLLMVTVLLVGRIPAVERAVGQDTLVRWHRRLGPWVIGLLVAHGLFITLGYAQGVKTGLAHEVSVLVTHFPGMLGAVVGLGLIVLAGVTSYRNVRKHLRPETWWTVHLYTYLAAAVAFSHQLATGAPFLGHPLARAYWISLWLLTAGVVLSYRVGLPLVRSLGHRLKVARVEHEAPGVVSVVVRGHHLERLPVTGGQFMTFRFLTRGMWWRGHPYSISALPGGNEMRITVKAAGEHSSALAQLEPGTPVADRGSLRRLHPARARDRPGAAGRRRRRRDASAGDARRPAAARRRGRHPARLQRPRPRPARRGQAARGRARRTAVRSRRSARASAPRRRSPAASWCPTSPHATSTSAAQAGS